MGSFQIHTHIDSSRVSSVGQPPWETIELDSYVCLDSLLHTPYAETARFSDYQRRGGESVRYYHLMAFERGLTLSLPASGHGRMISGIYTSRQLVAPGQAVSISEVLKQQDPEAVRLGLSKASYLWLNLQGGNRIIFRVNCLECFPHGYSISGSLRVPTSLLKGHGDSLAFSEAASLHLASSEPLFTLLTAATVDVPVCFQVDLPEIEQARLLIQVGSGDQVRLPLDGTPLILV